MAIDRASREYALERELDEVMTEEIYAVRGRIGGLRDPLPRADQAAPAICEDCGEEHTTYAAYRRSHRAEDAPDEARLCLGCIARVVHESQPVTDQLLGICTEEAR